VVTVPADKGDARNLTNTTGVYERTPSWSPDGKQIAYWSDSGGEYNLNLKNQNGMGDAKVIVMQERGFYFEPQWSPDSKRLAFTDNKLQLWTVELETGKQTKIDADTYYDPLGLQRMDPAWSPDSRWISYTKKLKNHLRAAFVYSVESGQSHQVTDGMSDAQSAVFDKEGKYLYFTASTDFAMTGYWLDMTSQLQQPTRSVYLTVLRKDLPSPVAPESDEEKAPGEKEQTPPKVLASQNDPKPPAANESLSKTTESEAAPKADKKPAETRIDFEGLGQRIIALPIPARNYEGLVAGKTGILYLSETLTPGVGVSGSTIHKFDLKTRKTEKLLDNVKSFSVSGNGEKMLFAQGETWAISPAGAAPKSGEGALKIASVQVRVDPKEEWKQMYAETWRIERDWFYDPNHHGVNIDVAAKQYQPWLDYVASRTDLNYLFQEMLGGMTVGHLYIGGGDTPEVSSSKTGLLGADFRIENNHFRFARVYSGENWNPTARAPLTEPGVNVKAGEYLLAVNGRAVTAGTDVYSYFEGTADKQTVLKVGSDPAGTGAREVTVVPIPSERQLRNLAWVEDNRRRVDQLSNGRIAYVYLPDTGQAGYANFNRYYFSQVGKEAAVIDERNNGGGQAADYVINFMSRPLLNYWTTRYGETFTTPRGAIFGPKAMIINESAGSGGDALPWYFRRMKLGPLVGKRTWGGLIGILGYPVLMDGGRVTAPNLAFFNPEGEWDVENHGVAPDVDVEDDPQKVREGRDPQLEKAVQIVMAELAKTPARNPRKPAYPNYHSNPTRRTATGGGLP
jgi:tricorn protease